STTEATSKEAMPEAKATAEQNWYATWDPWSQRYRLEQYLGTDPAIVVPNEYNGKPTEIRCDNGILCQKVKKSSVTSITFSNENGKKVKLEPTVRGYTDFTMRDHSSLRYFDGSGLDISGIDSLHMAFCYDRQLTTIKGLENWDTSNIETMYAMFGDCSSLKSLDVSSFNTKKVWNTSEMFEGCSSLKSLDVSNFDMSHVELVDSMFAGCSSLKSLDVSNFDLSSVSFGYNMFKNCINLQFFDARNWNIPSTAADISNMFSIDNGKAPLVILGNDDRLIQGTTKNRYPGGPKFVAGNNGYFGTAETKEKYYFNMLEKDPKKLEVASFEAFKKELKPTVVDSTAKFLRWDGDKITTSEELVKEHV
ncbi:BspA family leucine-rich repeat surface protein, partial [Enterococcus faecalis]|nr:BspA family leucine-rich repeat surface protein [Enterococcus faecalis]